mgnify:CR=1 FL=1
MYKRQFINTTENVSGGVLFNHTFTDPDLIHGDVLNSTWYLDGVIVNKSNTTYIYFPGFCDSGVHNLTLNVSDSGGLYTTVNWTINVTNLNRPPIYNKTIANMTWPEDTNLTDNLTLSEHFYDLDHLECGDPINKDNIIYTVSGNVNINISINQSTSNVSFYPKKDWYGVEYITFTINDSYNTTTTDIIKLNVTNVNDPPVLQSISNQTAYVGINFVMYVSATDVDSSSLTFSDNTTLFNITNYDATTGIINFTAGINDIGNHSVNISVSDGELTDSAVAIFYVYNNTAPKLTPIGGQTASEGTFFELYMYASDDDTDDLTFSANTTMFSVQTLNSSGVNATGYIGFTPGDDDVGNHTIRITVTDSKGATDYEDIHLNISGFNNPPELEPIPDATVKVNQTYYFDVEAADLDNDTLYFGDNSTFFDINESTGEIKFTGNSSYLGTHCINITVNDSEKFDSQLVYYTIVYNTNPGIDAIPNQTIYEDVPFIYYVTGYDYEGDTLNYTTNSTLFNISFFNTTTGLINFTPNITEVGYYSIMINVSDGFNGTNSTMFMLNITPRNDAPYFINLTNMNFTEDNNSVYYIYGYDEEGDNLTMSSNSTMFNITWVNSNVSMINFTPTNEHVGNYSVNFSITDGVNTTYRIINITVINTNDAPIIYSYTPNMSDVSVAENSSIWFNLTNVTDPDGDPLIFMWLLDGTNQSGNQSWLYQPNWTAAGNYNLTVIVRDPYNATDRNTWNLTVNNTNRPPVFNGTIQNLTWPEDTNLTNNFTITNFFYDPDIDDNFTFRTIGNFNITIVINMTTYNVSLYPDPNFYGVNYVTFIVNDSYNYSYSNNVTMNVTPVNDAPWLGVVPNQSKWVGDNVTIQLNATDPDGDTLYYWTNATFFAISDSGLINFTVTSSMVGNHTVNITVNDSILSTSRITYFSFNGTNERPNITEILPYGTPISNVTVFNFTDRGQFPRNITSINVSENTTVIFNHTTTDVDNDTIISRWYLDNVLVNGNHSWSWSIGFKENGTRNVTLVVRDGHPGNEDRFTWNVSVLNTNRIPIFGIKKHANESDFTSGIHNRTSATLQRGNVTLSKLNDSCYYANGTFISSVIDFGDDTIKPFLRSISWRAYLPAGTNITLWTRTSANTVTWTNWSGPLTESSGSPIAMSNSSVQTVISAWSHRYMQYLVNFSTTNQLVTPVLEEVVIRYEIANLQKDEDQVVSDWIDLDDYFRDPDVEDTLSFYAEDIYNVERLGFNITSGNVVAFTSPQVDWYGEAKFRICAKDKNISGTEEVCSNEITVTVVNTYDSPQQVITVQTSGGGGSSRTVVVTRTKVENITQPMYLELIVPQPLVTYPNNTIVAPIKLQNNGNISIGGITLDASTNQSGIILTFEKQYFDILNPGESTVTNLIIDPRGSLGSFQINVTATAASPDYMDSAIIFLSSMPDFNRTIRFVRDLLSTNPECLELNELLEEARVKIVRGDYANAKKMLDDVIEGCRYLISVREKAYEEQPLEITTTSFFKKYKTSILIVLFAFVATIIGIIIIRWIQERI